MPKRYLNPDQYSDSRIIVCPSVANLRLQTPPTYKGSATYSGDEIYAIAIVIGSTSAFDGTAAIYAWNPSSVLADNGTTIVAASTPAFAGNAGRWQRVGGTL